MFRLAQLSPSLAASYAVWAVFFVAWFAAGRSASRPGASPEAGQQRFYLTLNVIGFAMIFWPEMRSAPPLWRNPPAVEWSLVGAMVLGFVFCGWARLHLGGLWSASVTRKEDHRIVDTGPYAIVRHPIYTGMIVSGLALAFRGASLIHMIGAGVFVISWWVKARLEERFLSEELGAASYVSYSARVPMLIPLWPTTQGRRA